MWKRIPFIHTHRMVILVTLCWGVVLAVYAVARHERLNSTTYDLGIEAQVIWNTWQGEWFASSIEVDNYLGDHAAFIVLLLAPLFGLWADVRILLIFQALMLAAGALPLFQIAQRWLNDRSLATLFAVVYLLYPLIGFANRFDFHPLVLVIPLLLLAYNLLELDHPGWATLAILLTLSVREEMGLTVFAFGLYVALVMVRPRLGLAWAAVGLTWSLLALFVVIPAFRSSASDTLGRYAWLGERPVDMLLGLLREPGRVLQHFLVPYRALVPVKLLLPVGFLSLLAPLMLLVALPALAYNLLSSAPSQSSIYFHYLAPAVPFIFIAAVQGANRIQNWLTPERARLVVVSCLVFGTLSSLILDNPFTKTINDPYYEVKGLEQLSDARSFQEAAALLPRNAEVATMPNYGPHLALRSQLHIFHDRARLFERPHSFPQTEYILIHLTDLRGDENTRFFYNAVQIAIGELGYGALYADNDVILLQKSADPQPLTTGVVLQRVQELLDDGGKYSPAASDTIAWMASHWISDTLPEKATADKASFEDGIDLSGHISPTSRLPGQPLCVTLYWQTETEVTNDYVVFVHLVAADGFVQAQRDSEPIFGYYPTSSWKPGEVIGDMHCLYLPLGTQEGTYFLRAGLYDRDDGQRLTVLGESEKGDSLDLLPIRIVRSE